MSGALHELHACAGDPPKAQPVSRIAAPTVAPAATPPASSAPATAADSSGWQHAVQQLETENRRLAAERDYWKAEAARYQQGLQRAVDELNRMAAAGRVAGELAELRAAAAAPQPPEQAHVWASEPQVQILGDQHGSLVGRARELAWLRERWEHIKHD